MAVFPADQIFYVETFEAGEITANATVTHALLFNHDGYINSITWSELNTLANERAEMQVYYEDGDVLHTAPALGLCAAGNGGFPLYFKRPLVISRNDNLFIAVGDISGQGIDTRIDVVFSVTPRKALRTAQHQGRTKLYTYNFYNIPTGGQQQTQAVTFRHPGKLYAMTAEIDSNDEETTLVSAKILNKGPIIAKPTPMEDCCGHEHRPYWFKVPIKVDDGDVLQVTM